MPTIDFSQFAQIAKQLITDFGVSATLTHKPAGTYVPGTSTASATASTQSVVVAAFPFPEHLIDGTAIRVGDLQIIMSVKGVLQDPKPADKLTYLGEPYIVVNVKSHKPGGVLVLYELQVRK